MLPTSALHYGLSYFGIIIIIIIIITIIVTFMVGYIKASQGGRGKWGYLPQALFTQGPPTDRIVYLVFIII
jgi:hypothetical protein